MDVKKMTAPCGLACFSCAVHKDNITDELTQKVTTMTGMKAEDAQCEGCRSENGCCFEMPFTDGKGCPTKQCVERKGLHNCSECDEFPCENLMPAADGADIYQHNVKLYNLSRIKLLGLEVWAKEAASIQEKYFQGKFTYGAGPVLQEDTKQSK